MRSALLLVCLVLVLPACGGSASDEGTTTQSGPQEPVADFFQRQFEYRLWGLYGRAWGELHPGQKALVPRNLFVDCSRSADPNIYPSLEVGSVNVLSMYAEDAPSPIGVAGETLEVTMELTIVDPGVREETTTETLHTATVDGQFVWMLPSRAVRAFQKGRCPSL